jgi:hypothetical protein
MKFQKQFFFVLKKGKKKKSNLLPLLNPLAIDIDDKEAKVKQ